MPDKPEFISIPEFFSFHCTETSLPLCATCPRDFVLHADAIQGMFKCEDGKAIILVRSFNYCPGLNCGVELRFVKTSIAYDAAKTILDGKITDMGEITMVRLDYVTKG